ncbi:MAG: 30S ribosomal protein S3 [Candidatus Pacearchaeota archaeon]|jgi:small subunit ribosomal protein S3
MEEKEVVNFKKQEFAVREMIKKNLGKGKVSRVKIQYTPVGEKIIVSTHKPGLVIGRKGEKIEELTNLLRRQFKLENLHIEIDEIKKPEFDAQIMADEIALSLERFGPIRFKVTAYRTLQRIINAGALGVEIRLNGKLPGARAKPWRFAQGYLKKTGDSAKVVDRAQARAETKPGTVGIKVSILSPTAVLKDKIVITEELLKELKKNAGSIENVLAKTSKKKITKKDEDKKDLIPEKILVEENSDEEVNEMEDGE